MIIRTKNEISKSSGTCDVWQQLLNTGEISSIPTTCNECPLFFPWSNTILFFSLSVLREIHDYTSDYFESRDTLMFDSEIRTKFTLLKFALITFVSINNRVFLVKMKVRHHSVVKLGSANPHFHVQ